MARFLLVAPKKDLQSVNWMVETMCSMNAECYRSPTLPKLDEDGRSSDLVGGKGRAAPVDKQELSESHDRLASIASGRGEKSLLASGGGG